MPLPPRLNFRDRIASHRGAFYVQCRRAGHRRIRKGPIRTRREAEDWRSEHDGREHSAEALRRQAGAPIDVTLGEACAEYMRELEELELLGDVDPKTVGYYRAVTKRLREGFGDAAPMLAIRQAHVVKYGLWRKKTGKTAGARALKELKALQTIARAVLGHFLAFSVARARIRPKTRGQLGTLREIDTATVLRLLAATPEASVERAYLALKVYTGMRDEEIRRLNVGNVDLPGKMLRFELRAKATSRPHEFPLEPEAIDLLSPWVAGRRRSAPLLTIEGRRLGASSLRKRFLRASERAKIRPPVGSVGQIRHEWATAIAERYGPYALKDAIGHASVRTSERYIRRGKGAQRAAAKAARVRAKLIRFPREDAR